MCADEPRGVGHSKVNRCLDATVKNSLKRLRRESVPDKKTEISIEYEEVVLIRDRKHPLVRWCADCRKRVLMVEASDAARLAGISTRALYRSIESGQVHFTEAPDGSVLICESSVSPAQRRELSQQVDGATEAIIDIKATSAGGENEK